MMMVRLDVSGTSHCASRSSFLVRMIKQFEIS